MDLKRGRSKYVRTGLYLTHYASTVYPCLRMPTPGCAPMLAWKRHRKVCRMQQTQGSWRGICWGRSNTRRWTGIDLLASVSRCREPLAAQTTLDSGLVPPVAASCGWPTARGWKRKRNTAGRRGWRKRRVESRFQARATQRMPTYPHPSDGAYL